MSDLRKKFETDIGAYTTHISADEFDYTINISLRYGYVYVENAKVACSTIKLILQRMELDDPCYHGDDLLDIHTRIYSPMIRPSQVGSFRAYIQRPGTTTFCFVRNPYTRLLSAYLDKILNNMPAKESILAALGHDQGDIQRPVSFRDFVSVIARQSVSEMNPHWRVQYYQTFQDNIRYTFIGRFEKLEQDYRNILDRINPEYERYWGKEKRHATNSSALIDQYYSDEIEDIVYRCYQKDFKEFGYSRL